MNCSSAQTILFLFASCVPGFRITAWQRKATTLILQHTTSPLPPHHRRHFPSSTSFSSSTSNHLHQTNTLEFAGQHLLGTRFRKDCRDVDISCQGRVRFSSFENQHNGRYLVAGFGGSKSALPTDSNPAWRLLKYKHGGGLSSEDALEVTM